MGAWRCALEDLEGLILRLDGLDREFWNGKRVLLTGHTGFKGSWASLWLSRLGADVTGYALAPDTEPNLFSLAAVESVVRSITGDLRDEEALRQAVAEADPQIVIHMAAHPLVRRSYADPIGTSDAGDEEAIAGLVGPRISHVKHSSMLLLPLCHFDS